MKTFVLTITLFISTAAFSANINCADEEGVWKVTLQYEDEIARNINFYKNDELVKSFQEQPVHVSRMRLPFSSRGLVVYETALNGINYFDFERNFRGSDIETTFVGKFLISNNPVGFEKHVVCKISEE